MTASTATKRHFKITEGPEALLITQVEEESVGTYSDRAAWAHARSQGRPVFVETFDGGMQEFGVVFDIEKFENAAYQGYVAYGFSMSDGIYYPIDRKTWIASFRKDALNGLDAKSAFYGNDAGESVRQSYDLYKERLQAAQGV